MSHPLFTDLPSARLYVAYRNIAKMIRGTSEWKKEQFGKEVCGFLCGSFLDIRLAQRVPEWEASTRREWPAAGSVADGPGIYTQTIVRAEARERCPCLANPLGQRLQF